MTYQQWDHHQHYQCIPEYRALIQPWQHELGCPTPRPRSYSLGSRPPSSAELMEVSTKRTYIPSPLILPLDCNRNYTSTFPLRKSLKSYRSTKNKLFWLILFLILVVAMISSIAWWKYRTRPSVPVESFDLPNQPVIQHPSVSHHSPQQQHQHQQVSHQPYHPLPPLSPVLQSHSQQQLQQKQYPAKTIQQTAYWQQQQQQQLYQHYQQPQYLPEGYVYQQQPQQHHYSYPPQQQQTQQYIPQPAQDQHRQHQQPPPQHHPNVVKEFSAPKAQKPLIIEHMILPTTVKSAQQSVPEQGLHEHQANQQQHPPVKQKDPEPELSRQEERAKARNEARSSNPKTKSKKLQNDDIWEKDTVVGSEDSIVHFGDLETLRFEPAQFSFNQSFERSDGIIYFISYEDSEDVTVEVVEEA